MGIGKLTQMRSGSSFAYRGALVAIVILAAIVRVYNLGDLPAGFFCDEAGLGYNAYSILQTGRDENGEFLPLFIWSFGVSYKNPIFIYAATGPIAALGLSEFSVRLTAALFGILGVIAIGVAGRLMLGAAGGLIAALLLALCPWHVHFSRIAFELIALPPLLLFGFAALVAGVRGRPRWLLVAGPLFSLCLYAYAPAKLFVPLFLVGAMGIYARRLWAVRRWALVAALLAVLTATPAVVFDLKHRDQAGQYFSRTTILQADQSLRRNGERVFEQYRRFFSPQFLFERGDPIPRHSVPGFGELYVSMLPLLALGLLWALWPGHPEGKLLLWWLLLYPLAPSLMNEVPSASRGFVGVAAFCLLAAGGAVVFLRAVRWLLRWPRVAFLLQALAILAFFAVLGREAWRYGQAYVSLYPGQAAAAFQYGYREALHFMESRRGEYDTLLLTANRVNQPQIFTAFYNATDPRQWQRTRDAGYLIIDPAEYGRYDLEKRMLAALREDDLRLFEEYAELHRVVAPNGQVEYVIAEPHKRRNFIRDWLLLGPFDNTKGLGVRVDHVAPDDVTRRVYRGASDRAYWRRVLPQFVHVDLNAFYRRTAEMTGRSLEWLCAYATTQLEVGEDQRAMLELTGGCNAVEIWMNGERVTTAPVALVVSAKRWPIELKAGPNEVLVKLCKTVGEWHFRARVTDAAGRDLPGVTVLPVLRRAPAYAAGEPQVPEQLVDGFGTVARFSHQSDLYADYRGNSPAWWERLGDADGALVWQTAPVERRVPTVFIFTAAMGDAPGEAELWVNDHYALKFPTGSFPQPQRWQRGPYVLEFFPRRQGHNLSGYWLLQVPAEEITAGQPAELRVAHVDGSPHAFFMIKGRRDTAAHESVSLQSVSEGRAGSGLPPDQAAGISPPP